MNKVTRDIALWLDCDLDVAAAVHHQLMLDGLDFSQISDRELMAEAQRVYAQMQP